jgi:hypothetical protein
MEKMDFVSGADAANPKTLLDKLGLSQLNPAETAVKTAFNMAIGKPVSVLFDLLRGLLPKQDPRQTALNEFYNLDDIGRVAEGELMAGYNPVYGGFPGISEPTYGLQDAYQKRIDTIEETLAKQKADGKTQSQDLKDRLAELKEAKEKERLALRGPESLLSGDIEDRDLYHDVVAKADEETEDWKNWVGEFEGLGDPDKQATIPLGPEPDLEVKDIMVTEKQKRDREEAEKNKNQWLIAEAIKREKELADQRDRDEAAAKAREDAAATARENARRKADADRRAAEQRARDDEAARIREEAARRHDDPPPDRSPPTNVGNPFGWR